MKKSYKGKVERKRKRNTLKKRIITTKQKPTIRKKYKKPKTRRRKNKNKTTKKKYKKQVYKGGGGLKFPKFPNGLTYKKIMAAPVGEEKNTVLYEGKTIARTDTRHGEGKEFDFYTQRLVYSGNWNWDVRHGFGTSYHKANFSTIPGYEFKKYEGQWKKNKRHGFGTSYHKDNLITIPGYEFKKYYGKPEKTNGTTFYKIFDYDKINSGQVLSKEEAPEGILYEEEKERYINMQYNGQWENDFRNGEGTEYYENGNKKYEGRWKDGKEHGKGIEYYEDGKTKKYDGQWEKGEKHGEGILYHENGNETYNGQWENGNKMEIK